MPATLNVRRACLACIKEPWTAARRQSPARWLVQAAQMSQVTFRRVELAPDGKRASDRDEPTASATDSTGAYWKAKAAESKRRHDDLLSASRAAALDESPVVLDTANDWYTTNNSGHRRVVLRPVKGDGSLAFQKWQKYFLVLWSTYTEGKRADQSVWDEMMQDLDTEAVEVAKVVIRGRSSRDIAGAWAEYGEVRRLRWWPDAMLYLLAVIPSKANVFLMATFDRHKTPRYAVTQALRYLINRIYHLPRDERLAYSWGLCVNILWLMDQTNPTFPDLVPPDIRTLASNLDAKSLSSFWLELEKRGLVMRPDTHLHVAKMLARDEEYKGLAVGILEKMTTWGFDINTASGASICTAILSRQDNAQPARREGASPADLFSRLLACGLEPNMITYTTVMRNLCQIGDVEAAREVLALVRRHGARPDGPMYSVLLHGATKNRRWDILQDVFLLADSDHLDSPKVYADVLVGFSQRAILEAKEQQRQELKDDPVHEARVIVFQAFLPLLQLYAEFYDLGPLQPLIPVDLKTALSTFNTEHSGLQHQLPFITAIQGLRQHLSHRGNRPILQPTKRAIGVMLASYIQGLPSGAALEAFYAHLRHVIRDGDSAAATLLWEQGSFAHDTVMKALIERGMLQAARGVFDDMAAATMLEGQAASAATSEYETPAAMPPSSSSHDATAIPTTAATSVSGHPPPSVHSWNILLFGLMQHRSHVGEAELLIKRMQRAGVPITLTTWNSMLKGYAKLSDEAGVAYVLQRLQAAGFRPDHYTEKALASLGERGAQLLDQLNSGNRQPRVRGSNINSGGSSSGRPERRVRDAIDARAMQKPEGERELRSASERDPW